MKKVSFLYLLFLCGVLFSSCHSDDDTWGDWAKSNAFEGQKRVSAVGFQKGDVAYLGMGFNFELEGADKYNQTFYKFDGNSWENVEKFPTLGRKGSVAFVIGDTAYVGAGFRQAYKDDPQDHYYSDFYKFDLKTEKWAKDAQGNYLVTDIADFVTDDYIDAARFWGGVAFEQGGKGYVGTGQLDGRVSKTFFEYDPKTGKWSVCTGAKGFPGEPCVGAVTFKLAGQNVVCMGSDGMSNVLGVYTFDGSTWTSRRKLKNLDGSWNDDYDRIPRSYGVAFTSTRDGEKGYVCGGNSMTVWEYRLNEDRWYEATQFPAAMAMRIGAIGFSIDGYGYITTGGSDLRSANDNSTWKFIPGVDEWDQNDY